MNGPIGGLRRRACLVARLNRLAFIALLAAVLPATTPTAGAADAARQSAAPGSSMARCSTGYLTSVLRLSHVTVNSAILNTTGGYTPPGATTPITGLPGFCAVALTQTDPADNPIHITVWLPAKWNGRFQGIGGGGYACGIFYAPAPGYVSPSLAETLKGGYASAATDCGVPSTDGYTGGWALKPDGRLDPHRPAGGDGGMGGARTGATVHPGRTDRPGHRRGNPVTTGVRLPTRGPLHRPRQHRPGTELHL